MRYCTMFRTNKQKHESPRGKEPGAFEDSTPQEEGESDGMRVEDFSYTSIQDLCQLLKSAGVISRPVG